MGYKKGDIIELRVEKMAFGGEGISRINGLVVFIKGGVPGDILKARIIKVKKDFLVARAYEIISPSSHRCEPVCRYTKYCGGCQWQNIKYESQLIFKEQTLMDALIRIGGMKDAGIEDIIPSKKIYEYRNKMEFSFSDRIWYLLEEKGIKETENRDFALGLHLRDSFDRVLDIKECRIQNSEGNLILSLIRDYVKSSGEPVYSQRSHEGFWRIVILRHSLAENKWMVNIVSKEERDDLINPLVKELLNGAFNIGTITNNINEGRAGVSYGSKEIICFGPGYIYESIGPFRFRISANSFFQTNSYMIDVLFQKIEEFAELSGKESLLDLYSGTGTMSIFLSRSAKEVVGVEISESAYNDALLNLKENGIDNCTFLLGDAEERLRDLSFRPHVIVIDPPRPGISKKAMKVILDMEVDRIVYVSCNPSTLARDLSLLSEKYDIIKIQPVDMFPHTYHTEVISMLKLKK